MGEFARFAVKVDDHTEDDSCWEWLAGRFNTGYGAFRTDEGRTVTAHRFAWELEFGPTDLQINHHCDNRGCARTSHMYAGTHQNNMNDAIARNRFANSHKIECPQGHPYSEKNTFINVRGSRECVICRTRSRAKAHDRKMGRS